MITPHKIELHQEMENAISLQSSKSHLVRPRRVNSTCADDRLKACFGIPAAPQHWSPSLVVSLDSEKETEHTAAKVLRRAQLGQRPVSQSIGCLSDLGLGFSPLLALLIISFPRGSMAVRLRGSGDFFRAGTTQR